MRAWFAVRKHSLLEERIASLDAETTKLAHRVQGIEETRARQVTDRDSIRQAISENGGDRIERIKREISDKQKQKEERARRAGQYNESAKSLGLPPATDADAFVNNKLAIGESRLLTEATQTECTHRSGGRASTAPGPI